MDEVDRLRLKLMMLANTELLAATELLRALAEAVPVLSMDEVGTIAAFVNALSSIATDRTKMFDAIVSPHVVALRERLQ